MGTPYTLAGQFGHAHVASSADAWTVFWNGQRLTFRSEIEAHCAGVALAFNGCSLRHVGGKQEAV